MILETIPEYSSDDSDYNEVDKKKYRLDADLGELKMFAHEMDVYSLGYFAADSFQSNPHMPGLILTKKGELTGMITRRHFFEYLSKKFGREIFLNRPLKETVSMMKDDYLILPVGTTIVSAARQALHRPQDTILDPILVELPEKKYRIIDVHQLLLAQARIHEIASGMLRKLNVKLAGANQELNRLANSDGLTKLTNRRRFDACLRQEWQRLARAKAPLSLLLGDVDFFKKYNDTYGHQAGDECLKKVASCIRNRAQRPADCAARYGGEEFAVILPDTPVDGANNVAKGIMEDLAKLRIPHIHSDTGFVTMSFGICSLIPDSEKSPETVLKQADISLYEAKKQGKNRIAAWSSDLKPSQPDAQNTSR